MLLQTILVRLILEMKKKLYDRFANDVYKDITFEKTECKGYNCLDVIPLKYSTIHCFNILDTEDAQNLYLSSYKTMNAYLPNSRFLSKKLNNPEKINLYLSLLGVGQLQHKQSSLLCKGHFVFI